MSLLPEKFEAIIKIFVEELAKQSTVNSVGLFGSWVRYEESETSDFDILIIRNRDIDHEIKEALVYNGLLIDMASIPLSWIEEVVRPEVDQMIHETAVLYDPDGSLTRAKNFVKFNYMIPGRVEVRTGNFLTIAETYLSRASAAITREDFESSLLFSDISLIPIAHLLMDISRITITRSAFIWNFRRACEKLKTIGTYKVFMNSARLSILEKGEAKNNLNKFNSVWLQISSYMKDNIDIVENLHPKLKMEIEYLTSPATSNYIFSRTSEMLEKNNYIEATMYMREWLRPFLEAYAWVAESKRGGKFNYITIFKALKETEREELFYNDILNIYNLHSIEATDVRGAMKTARSIVSYIRRKRLELIRNYVG